MKIIAKKLISIALTLSMIWGLGATTFAVNLNNSAYTKDELIVAEYTITIESDTPFVSSVSYVDENGSKYLMVLDKVTHEITLEIIADASSVYRRMDSPAGINEKYSVFIEDADPGIGEVSGVSLISSDGFVFEMPDPQYENGKSSAVWVIPIGIALAEALIEALLALGLAIVIGGVVWIVITEAVAAMKSQSAYSYYLGMLRYDELLVGNGITFQAAIVEIAYNSPQYGVIATNSSYAYTLANSFSFGCYHHNPHGGSGYLPHYHSNTFSTAHCWYIT